MKDGKAYFIGVDAGTTRIKASVYDQDLVEIGSASREVIVCNPAIGMSEIDMDVLWEFFCLIIWELKSSHGGLWNKIKGIGISGQGDGLWPIDKNGNPARQNAIIWNDTRSRVLEIEKIPGLDTLLRQECANAIYTGSMPALQKWLKLNEKNVYGNIYKSLHCKDWLNFKLTGEAVSDYSDITCSSSMNIMTLSYIPGMFRLLDIEEMMETMPRGTEPCDIIGTVLKKTAEETGLPQGIPVLAGSIDCCSVSAGTGFFREGEGCTIIGTALINEVCIGKEKVDPNDLRGYLLYHVVKNRYIKMMGTKSGTSSIDFFKGLLCPGDDMKKLDAEIDRIPVGSSGIVIHPYLAGERAPFNSPYAFSSIMGMCSGHSRYEIMRAAYEGLAMSFLDSYKSLPAIEMLYLTGGASKSPIVCRMYCDVIGLPIKRQAAAELGTLGIAKMLAVTLGFADSFEKLGSNTFTEYEPDMKKHEQYLELYSKFVSYRNSMEKHWKNE